jgi:membrane fusion protein (multidrug efflux system)
MGLRRHAALLAMLMALFGAWAVWLGVSQMTVYLRSQRARLESAHNPVIVNAPVDGVVVECGIDLGRSVERGDVLVRLEAHSFELQARELRAEIEGREAALASLRARQEVELAAREVMAEMVGKTARAGSARIAANERSASSMAREHDIIGKLHEANLASRLEELRTSSEVGNLQMQVRLASAQASLDTANAKMSLRDRDIRVSVLAKDIIDVESELKLSHARLDSLEFEVERRIVRASTGGVLADVTPCSLGMSVTPALRLATVLPASEVRVVAYFSPSESIGRIQRGQLGIVRVENFPWTQYGTLRAQVTEVGTEPRDGVVRVELSVQPSERIPVTHGLVATVEVETERTTPAKLILRMAGQPWTSAAATNPVSLPDPRVSDARAQ